MAVSLLSICALLRGHYRKPHCSVKYFFNAPKNGFTYHRNGTFGQNIISLSYAPKFTPIKQFLRAEGGGNGENGIDGQVGNTASAVEENKSCQNSSEIKFRSFLY